MGNLWTFWLPSRPDWPVSLICSGISVRYGKCLCRVELSENPASVAVLWLGRTRVCLAQKRALSVHTALLCPTSSGFGSHAFRALSYAFWKLLRVSMSGCGVTMHLQPLQVLLLGSLARTGCFVLVLILVNWVGFNNVVARNLIFKIQPVSCLKKKYNGDF